MEDWQYDQAFQIYEELRITPPPTKLDLWRYLKIFLGIEIPSKSFCPGHSAPLDYLWHSFCEPDSPSRDAVIWACRGGGKTLLGAVATLLDCLFKPGCQVRILGGSLEQSRRMYEYLNTFLDRGYRRMLTGRPRKSRCDFKNGSSVEILTQSPRNVRGRHVQKLRCDEVEHFDRDVLAAARFVTCSIPGAAASMEILSTMHKPYGLMHEEVANAQTRGTRIFKWCLWEVIEKCVGRSCSQCPLAPDCGGRAKEACGYFRIDDAVQQMQRSSRSSWESEMLCVRPSLEDAVFGEFDRSLHIKPVDYDPSLPLYRSIDFGFVNPFVCLWLQVDNDGLVRVIDEYVRTRASIETNVAAVKSRTPCSEERVAATFCDPSGTGANSVTGTSPVSELRALGIYPRYKKSGILEGIELIRRALRDGRDKTSLIVSPRCPRLIEALECYHYPQGSNRELPEKDGVYDHPIDALRYFFVNYQRSWQTTVKCY